MIPSTIQHKLLYSKRLLTILDSEIEWYLNEKSDDMIREQYKSPSGFRAALEGAQAPILISLTCGDVLQNTRSVLDYLVWELVLANNNHPDEGNAFPVCKSPDTFKDAKRRRLAGIHPDAITIIESLQPYHFGQGNEIQSVVFVLDKLANIQKHRTILIAQERHAPTEIINVVDSSGNVLGFDPLRAVDTKATAKFIKTAIEAKMNAQMAVYVVFGEEPAKGMEVISVVAGLYETVALEIIPRFNRFFA